MKLYGWLILGIEWATERLYGLAGWLDGARASHPLTSRCTADCITAARCCANGFCLEDPRG